MSCSSCEAAAIKRTEDDYGTGLKVIGKGDCLIGGCFGGDSGKARLVISRDKQNRRTRLKLHQSSPSSLPLPSLFRGWWHRFPDPIVYVWPNFLPCA